MDWAEYEEKLRTHDWFYAMSDDFRVYTDGRNSERELTEMMKAAKKEDEERAVELYNKYVPSW